MENKNQDVNDLHFKYVIGILIFLLILVATAWLGRKQVIVEQIGFAATLASLILAVLAIIYSFVSNQSLSATFGKLDSAGANVGTAAERVTSAATDLQDRIEILPEVIADKFSLILPMLTQVSQKVEATQSLLHDRLQGVESLSPYPPTSRSKMMDARFDEEVFYENSSLLGKFLLFACALSYEKEKPLDIAELSKEVPVLREDYMLGFLVAAHAANYIGIKAGRGVPLAIWEMGPELIELSKTRIYQSITDSNFDETFESGLIKAVGSIKSFVNGDSTAVAAE